MYKLIAMDLDGTLLNSNKEISKENLNLVHELIDSGYEVVIATGRRYWSAKHLTRNIKRDLTILSNNGNIVRSSKNDKIMMKKYLNIEDFKLIINEGKTRGLNPIVHIDKYEEGYDLILEQEKNHKDYYNYISKHDNRYKIVDDLLNIDDSILAIVYAGDKDILYNFYNDINSKYPKRYNSHVMENIEVAEALLEIMNPLGSKWLTLEEYVSKMGIDPREVIAIGDDNNDVEIIKNSGLGIAMKNGSEKVKSVANIITERDNDESGVAFELKRILNM